MTVPEKNKTKIAFHLQTVFEGVYLYKAERDEDALKVDVPKPIKNAKKVRIVVIHKNYFTFLLLFIF